MLPVMLTFQVSSKFNFNTNFLLDSTVNSKNKLKEAMYTTWDPPSPFEMRYCMMFYLKEHQNCQKSKKKTSQKICFY